MKKILLLFFAIYANFAFGQVINGVKHIPTEKTEAIYEDVENIAEFPGGINAFREEFIKKFRVRKIDGIGNISCVIYFVIERDGTMNEVSISGTNSSFNKEADLAIKKIIQKWTPANINGVNVRYKYRMPIAMAF